MKQVFALIIILISFQSRYMKSYYNNDVLKSEGWIKDNKKTNYWYFYYQNSQVEAKGHFFNGQKTGYWFYYDQEGNCKEKGHYKNSLKEDYWTIYQNDTVINVKYHKSKKNGLAILKLAGKIVKAEYYKEGIKTNEWVNFANFKKEYPLIND